ncbi:MAG TPA: HlyD family efflux transporter periplasmic adaptor subunit [Vicinamibacterales bacterium]|nr:HlyD family efflux transporter periplasmic adaptor subunit [Vicinamibacterales bacterium]
MNVRRIAIASVVIVLLGGALAVALTRVAPAPARRIPTTRGQRGRVQVTVYTIGELRAGRAAQLIAPPIGGNLTIIKFAPSGEPAKAGDVIVEFDPAEQSFALEQARFDLAQAEQEIAKADAAAAVQIAEDDVALLHAKYDVRRSELDAAGNELVSAIQAQQNLLLLGEARQRLAQLEKDVQSHRETTRASGNVLKEKRAKAELAVQVAERSIASLQMRAPFDGFVVSRQNTDALGGFCCPPGITLPDYRVGDSVGSGRTLADVIDTSSIEVSAKVNEQDRANVSAGQAVELAVDTLPDAKLRGSVRTVSGVASRQMWSSDSTRKFDVIFEVAGDPRVRPGATAQIRIDGPALENVLFIPRQAVFDNAGRATVYVNRAARSTRATSK